MKIYIKRLKRRIKYNRKANNIIWFVFVMFLFMGVGYAYLNATLSITGTGKVTKTTWDVHFENIQPISGSVTPTSAPVISNDTTVSFSATLNEPGDFYSFYIDLVNAGTIDASIGSLDITPVLTSEQQEYFEYSIKYKGGLAVQEGDALSHGDTKTIEIIFRYKELANQDSYPDEDVTFNFSITINSIQTPFNKEGSVLRTSSQSDTYAYKADTYRDKIKTITLDDHINPPSGYIESWDVSEGNNGNVMAYLTINSEDNTMYDLYIQGNGHLYAPENCSYLFGKMTQLEYINNLVILDTSNVMYMGAMFDDTGNIEILDLSSFDTSNVTTTYSMFKFTEDDGRNGLFTTHINNDENISKLRTIYVSSLWDVSQVEGDGPLFKGSTWMFNGCRSIIGGNGKTYVDGINDNRYAVIDTPSTPGYLTLKQ